MGARKDFKKVSSKSSDTKKDNVVSLAIFAGILSAVGYLCFILNDPHRGRTCIENTNSERNLHNEEAELIKSIFGQDFKTDNIELRSCENYRSGVAGMVPTESNTAMFFGGIHHSRNYVRSSIVYKRFLFIHEMTHIWQGQTHSIAENLAHQTFSTRQYHYNLSDTTKPFDSYGYEQQSSMVADYAMLFYYKNDDPVRISDSSLERKRLRSLIETRFPEAKRTRLFLEENGHMPWETPRRQSVSNTQLTYSF